LSTIFHRDWSATLTGVTESIVSLDAPGPVSGVRQPGDKSGGREMIKSLLYVAPIALVALTLPNSPANTAVLSGSLARDLSSSTTNTKDAPLVLVRRGGGGGFRGGGGGYRGGGGGFSRGGGGYAGRGGGGFSRGGGGANWAGAGAGSRNAAIGGNRGNFSGNTVNRGGNTFNRNVNVSGGGYYGGGYGGYGWGGVAAGVAAGAVVGAAAASPYYYSAPAYSYCPYPNYPNCGL
jgi:hypothetical protein